jgi:hypothetical protein
VSWLKYLWATLIGFAVTAAVATSSAALILWLGFSRYVERSCANNPMTTCSAWAVIGYGIQVIALCLFVGLFAGTFAGTTVGIHLYRRHQNSKPATANFKPGQPQATLVGFVVTVAVATLSAILILWLDFSRYLEPVGHGLVLGLDLGLWYGILVVAVSIFIGLFVGACVGTTVGIRRHQNSEPATANFKPGQ